MARIGNSILSLGLTAAGPVIACRFVGFDNNQVAVAGGKAKGVAEYAAAAGQPLSVTAKGTASVETGGTFNPGDPITSDAQGRAVASGQATDFIKGEALDVSAAPGQYVEIMLR